MMVHDGTGVAGLGGGRTANDVFPSFPALSSLSAFAHTIPSLAIVSPLSAQEVLQPILLSL